MTRKRFLIHERMSNLSKKCLGRVFAPSRHTLKRWVKIQKIHYFSPLNLQPKFWYVPYGCTYSPQALFLKIFDFFEKNRMYLIPWSFSSDENSQRSVVWKNVQEPIFVKLKWGFRRHPFGTLWYHLGHSIQSLLTQCCGRQRHCTKWRTKHTEKNMV